MSATNLLPPAQKKDIRIEEWRRAIRYIGVVTLCTGILGITFLLPSYFDLIFRKDDTDRMLAQQKMAIADPDISKIRKRVNVLSDQFNGLAQILTRPQHVSDLLDYFFLRLPPTVSLASVVLKKNGQMEFTGTATTRNDLLAFEEILRKSGMFQEILSPISNIIRERDIQFTLKGIPKKSSQKKLDDSDADAEK
ncbi:MAG: hypothetical protein G01um101466_33 [Parcubacteria group bacterium Gr01-1014_66]|nr:MAG: hypothetical protein G01um101466_33 [Parcubacteria group bacterium Gr01-1014_66]